MPRLRENSLSEEILSVLAQMKMATRAMLGAMMYREMNEDGDTELYNKKTKTMTAALTRVRDKGLVREIEYDGKKYLTLSKEGWAYATDRGFVVESNDGVNKSVGSEKDRKSIVGHATALCTARGMRVYSLSSEKPSFSDFAMKLNSMTYFPSDGNDLRSQQYPAEEIKALLECGVAYSRQEIRAAYSKTDNLTLVNNSSRRIGMIFKTDETIAIHDMERKNTALTVRGEAEFDNLVRGDTVMNTTMLVKPLKSAYILAPSILYIPSFFHGYVDGVEPRAKHDLPAQGDVVAKFKMGKFLDCERVYLMPKSPYWVEYREALYNYTNEDYERDLNDFYSKRPDVTGRCVVCRFPNLATLYNLYYAKKSVSLIGPRCPQMVDALSRCMRTYLAAYYDIETGEEVPFTRYNNFGSPLIKNTNSVDKGRSWLITSPPPYQKDLLLKNE